MTYEIDHLPDNGVYWSQIRHGKLPEPGCQARNSSPDYLLSMEILHRVGGVGGEIPPPAGNAEERIQHPVPGGLYISHDAVVLSWLPV